MGGRIGAREPQLFLILRLHHEAVGGELAGVVHVHHVPRRRLRQGKFLHRGTRLGLQFDPAAGRRRLQLPDRLTRIAPHIPLRRPQCLRDGNADRPGVVQSDRKGRRRTSPRLRIVELELDDRSSVLPSAFPLGGGSRATVIVFNWSPGSSLGNTQLFSVFTQEPTNPSIVGITRRSAKKFALIEFLYNIDRGEFMFWFWH